MTGAATTIASGIQLSKRRNRREHGRTGCDAIIDKDNGFTFDLRWWQIVAISFFAALELDQLLRGDSVDYVIWNSATNS